MMNGRSLALIGTVVATCAVGGCAPEAPAVERPLVVDSAGVEWTRHPAETARPLVDAREVRRIGAVNAENGVTFDRLVAIEPRGDRIYALDWGDNTIRAIDPDGRVLAVFGGRGEGPGEIVYPHRMVVGDSVWIADPAANRLSVFDLDGRFVRDERLGATAERYRVPVVRLASGWIAEDIDRGRARERERDRLHQDTVRLVFTHELARYGGDAALALPMGRSGDFGPAGFLVSPLFEPQGRVVGGPDGTTVHAPGIPYRIDVFDRRGRHIRRIEREHPKAPIRDDLVEQYLEYQRGVFEPLPRSAETDLMREAFLETAPTLPRPPYRPPVGRLLVAPDGSLLVERPDHDPHPFSPDDPAIWDHLDATGSLLARVRFPPRVTPLSLDVDGVWARALDDLDVHYAVRYRIDGGDAGPEGHSN